MDIFRLDLMAIKESIITNIRDDFVQKLSLKLVESYELIVFEDLNIKGMIKNHCLAKHIANVAWNKLMATSLTRCSNPLTGTFPTIV